MVHETWPAPRVWAYSLHPSLVISSETHNAEGGREGVGYGGRERGADKGREKGKVGGKALKAQKRYENHCFSDR